MAIKSYRLVPKKKGKRFKKNRFGQRGDIIKSGVTAVIGIGLLSETAKAVGRV